MQKIASRRSYMGSSLSIEKMSQLSRIRISFVSSKSVRRSIAFSPFQQRTALTWNFNPNRKLYRVDFSLDQDPIIVTTKSLLLFFFMLQTQLIIGLKVETSMLSISPSIISMAFPSSNVCDKTSMNFSQITLSSETMYFKASLKSLTFYLCIMNRLTLSQTKYLYFLDYSMSTIRFLE